MDDEDFFSFLGLMPGKLKWYERRSEKPKVAKSRLAPGTIF